MIFFNQGINSDVLSAGYTGVYRKIAMRAHVIFCTHFLSCNDVLQMRVHLELSLRVCILSQRFFLQIGGTDLLSFTEWCVPWSGTIMHF